jgi:3'(2'), 5'-bisphosphate nucleotidase
MNLAAKLAAAKRAALEAGARILTFYEDTNPHVRRKEDGSPLTQADLAANEIIVREIRSRFPLDPILTEEESDDPRRLAAERVWIVDPLDGTKGFVSRDGDFTVNIALARGGHPELGVVYAPTYGGLYYATEGQGAFFQLRDASGAGDGEAPPPVRIHVSTRSDPAKMIVARSRSHSGRKTMALLESARFAGVRSMGSSLKGCLIARGEMDAYFRFGPTNEWDICAMHAILIEAGGTLTAMDGSEMRYNRPDPLNKGFIASNNTIHAELVRMAARVADI